MTRGNHFCQKSSSCRAAHAGDKVFRLAMNEAADKGHRVVLAAARRPARRAVSPGRRLRCVERFTRNSQNDANYGTDFDEIYIP